MVAVENLAGWLGESCVREGQSGWLVWGSESLVRVSSEALASPLAGI